VRSWQTHYDNIMIASLTMWRECKIADLNGSENTF